jgi:hypothetical protein
MGSFSLLGVILDVQVLIYGGREFTDEQSKRFFQESQLKNNNSSRLQKVSSGMISLA